MSTDVRPPTDEITTREALEILGLTDPSTISRYVGYGKLKPSRKLPGRSGAVPVLAGRRRTSRRRPAVRIVSADFVAALNAVRQAAERHDEFTTDDVWPLLDIVPAERNVVGKAFSEACRLGEIIGTERFIRSSRPRRRVGAFKVAASTEVVAVLMAAARSPARPAIGSARVERSTVETQRTRPDDGAGEGLRPQRVPPVRRAAGPPGRRRPPLRAKPTHARYESCSPLEGGVEDRRPALPVLPVRPGTAGRGEHGRPVLRPSC